ncbi:DUF1648 domain-containing protein [Tengunoibacter tsumagoiensis]|uniref:Membrane protein n=1 Tax=Tengunoibacter tsumagoiensis TaxID=2014871 RepID=A0A401ZXF9_9CHLR|nr:DUF1648 domain-containing protein [Tengunoibacter tsumagoiensis]GCE11536.1 membrane protein [Tengunoibacter tsumagoiensis]
MVIEYVLPILLFCLILVLFWLMPSWMPTDLPFGVRVPPEREQDPAIYATHSMYRRGLLISAVLLALLSTLVGIFTSFFWIGTGSILVLVALSSFNYYRAHRRLALVKAQENWYAGLRQAVVADTEPHVQRPYFWLWLLPSLVLLLLMFSIGIARYPELPATIPTHFNAAGEANAWTPKWPGAFYLPLLATVLTSFFALVAWFIPGSRQALNPINPVADKARQQDQGQLWSAVLLLTGGFVNAGLLIAAFMTWQLLPANTLITLLIFLITLCPILLIAIAATVAAQRTRNLPHVANNGYVLRDDDRYWQAGLFYVNPDDPSLMVPKRFGIGWTLNFGHPQARLLIFLFVVFMLVITFLPLILR